MNTQANNPGHIVNNVFTPGDSFWLCGRCHNYPCRCEFTYGAAPKYGDWGLHRKIDDLTKKVEDLEKRLEAKRRR